MPFGKTETDAIQKQALRAVISANIAFRSLRNPEMLKLFGMLRSAAPDIIPSGKVLSGRLLNDAAGKVEIDLQKVLRGKAIGLSTDGWKSKSKDAVNAICANSDFEAYMLELIEVTALKKDGPALCKQFADMIDRIELRYGCVIIYFTTDADGGSKKGRVLLGKKRPWLILPSCWAHQFQLILGDYFKVNDMAAQIAEDATALIGWLNNHGKVRKIFDESQAVISKDRNAGKIIILAYLVANITRWTTHFVAFLRLFILQHALQLAVLQRRTEIIAAEVRAATAKERKRLEDDAIKFCALIEDKSFWLGLETVLGDLEPICLGTNINQKDSTRLDQVLLTIAGIFLRFADHPEPEVKNAMLFRLEKRWKACDQPVFLLALILNPFEMLSCFGPNAGLNHFKCSKLLLSLYQRMKNRPDNTNTPEQRVAKEREVSKAFLQYLSGTGEFTDWADDRESWRDQYDDEFDPIVVWGSWKGTREIQELASFAILILSIVANQAGCERTFSRVKIQQTDHRNRTGLEKLDKMAKVGASITTDHQKQGLYKPRKPRQNHKSTANLLSVPRYRDLLEDQQNEDESEHGCALVSTREGWQTQMAKWVSDTREAEHRQNSDSSDDNEEPPVRVSASTWIPITLAVLFGEAEKPRTRKASKKVMEEEELLMQALAEQEEDDIPDDGAIEIDSDDGYHA